MVDKRPARKPHVSTNGATMLADVHEEIEADLSVNLTNTSTALSQKVTPEPSQLHLLAINGNKIQLQALLRSNKYNVDETDHMGRTPLIYSVLGDRTDCVLILLGANANINLSDIDGRTALHWASYQGNHKLVKLLLAKRADYLERDKEGRTALHLCTSHDNIKVLQVLLNSMRKEDINTPDSKGMTSLCWSVFYERFDYVKLLLKHGAAPSSLDSESRTVLHWTSENKNIAVIKILLDGNSSLINWPDCEKRTILHMAVGQRNYKLVEFLLSLPDTDVNCKDKIERTPLHLAAVLKDSNMVKLLLSKAADHSLVDKNEVSVLHYAAQHEDSFETVQVLVQFGVQDKPDKDKGTALMWAAVKGHEKVVELLLKQNCSDVNATNVHGQTALHLAVQAGHLPCVKILITNGAQVDTLDKKHQIPLFYACASGHIDIVNELLQNDSSTKLDNRDLEGRSPLHYAAMVDRTDTIKKLIQIKLDPNTRDTAGRAPLHFAAYGGFVHCMNVLLENNADVNIQDNGGSTPLHLASRSGSIGAVKLLVSRYNANVNVFEKSVKEFTPLDYAISSDHQDVAFYLQENNASTASFIKEMSAAKIQALWKGYQFRKVFNNEKEHYVKHDKIRKEESDYSVPLIRHGSDVLGNPIKNSMQININTGSSDDVRSPRGSNFEPSESTNNNLLGQPSIGFRHRSNSELSANSYTSPSIVEKQQRGPKFSVTSNNPMSLRKISVSSLVYSPRSVVDDKRSQTSSPLPNLTNHNHSTSQQKNSSTSSDRNIYRYPKRQVSEISVFGKEQHNTLWLNKINQLSDDPLYRQSPISSSDSSDVIAKQPLSERNNKYRLNYSRHVQEPPARMISPASGSNPLGKVKPLNSILPSLTRKARTSTSPVPYNTEEVSLRSMSPPPSTDIFATGNSDKPWQLFRRDQKRINIIRQKTEAAIKIQKAFRIYKSKKQNKESIVEDLSISTLPLSQSYDSVDNSFSEDEDEEGLQEVAALVIQLAWRQYLKNKLMSESENLSTAGTDMTKYSSEKIEENIYVASKPEQHEEIDVPFVEENSSLDSSFEESKFQKLRKKKKLEPSLSLPDMDSNPMQKKRSRRFSLKKRLLQHSKDNTASTKVSSATNSGSELPSLKASEHQFNKSDLNAIKNGKPKLFLRGKSMKN